MVKKVFNEMPAYAKRISALHRVLGGPPPFQAKPADELVQFKRKGRGRGV